MRRITTPLLAPIVVLLASFVFAAPSALGAVGGEGPQWTVTSVSLPTNFSPTAKAGEDAYDVTVTNTGGAASQGPLEVTDELPSGLALDPAGASGENPLDGSSPGAGFSCTFRTCAYSDSVAPGQALSFTFPVDVLPAAQALSPLVNVVRVAGGGARDASMSTPTTISETPAEYGFAPGGAANAISSVQAGAHPNFTTLIAFDTINAAGTTAQFNKDLVDLLPAGFAGDLVDTQSCSGGSFSREECPVGSQVGITTIMLAGSGHRVIEPVYNLVPNAGEVAKIGFELGSGESFEAGVSLREPGERGPAGEPLEPYGLKTTFPNFNQSFAPITSVSLTVWGVPADPSHNPLRWNDHLKAGQGSAFGASPEGVSRPYFTNPTACTGQPPRAEVQIDSWEDPGRRLAVQLPFGSPIVGCDRLAIEPSLTAEVTSNKASSPSGLDVDTSIPQTYENAEGLATSTLKKEVVTLPEGMTVNPSSGAGLEACSEAQYAEEGVQYVEGRGCPNQSRLASVEIISPSLSEHVKGSLFLAEPAAFGEAGKNPFDSLLALYLIARIPNRGVLIESPGQVEPNLATGRLTTTFDNLPPLPFSFASFAFNQGAGAPIVTPPACGSYTVTAELTPYSNPAGAPAEPLIPPFEISSGVGGSPCPSGGVPPFKPQVISGTEDNDAGAYSPFYLRIVREDGEQEITKFTSIFPRGLTGNLSGIPFCSEADIEAARSATGTQELEDPSCPAASEIGHTLVGAGVGSLLAQAPGKIYLAGPYHGSALSVVSITAAKVGPFDLGTVVVRFALSINPITAQVEINGANSDPIPHIIKGIVVHVRDIRAYIDRAKFIVNPTSCNPSSISETITGAGANPANPVDQMTVGASAPFQAADCSSLKFKPTFKVSASGKTSRADGASLAVKLTYPAGSFGTQANIKSVKVDLPKQLPSRLTTLQKACTDTQFEANPAGCPPDSRVGEGKAITPILPVPLEGPAYFVSYGDAKFPELVIVLQGYGFTIDLHGETFISKAGITSSTFHAIPDEPVGSFELSLPAGPFSALAANGNLCTSSLKMPTAFTAQNGDTIHQATPIAVTGCAKHKAKKAKRTKKAGKHKKKR